MSDAICSSTAAASRVRDSWRAAETTGASLGAQRAALMRLATGHPVYVQGDPSGFVYQVVFGLIRTVSLTGDGARIIHGFHLPGEVFGEDSCPHRSHTAEAVCTTGIVRCEQASLQALADSDPAAAGALWLWLLQNRERTAEHLRLLARASALDRVLYFLFDLAARTASPTEVELPMSRYDIGDYLGLSNETVSRTFTILRNRGLIVTRGRSVLLLKPAKLSTSIQNLP